MKSRPLYPPDPPETPDPRDLQEHHAPELELQLLRHGLDDMAADRMRCSRCGRSPLVGERLHVFAAAPEDQHICELCLKQARRLGEPKRVERVGAAERRLIVRRAA